MFKLHTPRSRDGLTQVCLHNLFLVSPMSFLFPVEYVLSVIPHVSWSSLLSLFSLLASISFHLSLLLLSYQMPKPSQSLALKSFKIESISVFCSVTHFLFDLSLHVVFFWVFHIDRLHFAF